MLREDLVELHYITHLSNVQSICQLGILSHKKAKKIKHNDIANQEVQERRRKRLPNGRLLHDCVNLYICARNPMLYRRRTLSEDLCVLRLSTDVLDLEDVVIADRNAARAYVAFYPVTEGLGHLDKAIIFARYWTDSDFVKQTMKAGMKCAEVLVPNRIDPSFIMGAYVSCKSTKVKLRALGTGLAVTVNSDLFFQ